MWTLFWDMHSGGGSKEKWDKIYIEAPEEEARVIFHNRFGHNPDYITCECCGEDYSVDESETFEQASAYHRNCAWDDSIKGYVEKPDLRYGNKELISVEDYKKKDNVLVIPEKDIYENDYSR